MLPCVQAYMGVTTSAWSYNALISAWEPILEPWDFILKLDINSSAMVCGCLLKGQRKKNKLAKSYLVVADAHLHNPLPASGGQDSLWLVFCVMVVSCLSVYSCSGFRVFESSALFYSCVPNRLRMGWRRACM